MVLETFPFEFHVLYVRLFICFFCVLFVCLTVYVFSFVFLIGVLLEGAFLMVIRYCCAGPDFLVSFIISLKILARFVTVM